MDNPVFVYTVAFERPTKPYRLDVTVLAEHGEHAIAEARARMQEQGLLTDLAPESTVLEVAIVCPYGVNEADE